MRRLNKNTFLIFLVIFFFCGYSSFAQTDTEFWFGVPDITEGHCKNCSSSPGGEPIKLRIATLDLQSEIRVEIGDNRIVVQPDILLDPYESFTIDLTPFIDELENTAYGFKEEKALHVTATNKITAYFEEAEYNNPDIYSLKGSNALGTEFYIPTQNEWDNATNNYDPKPYGGFIITATKPSTEVNLDLTAPIQGPDPNPSSITLEKGQTFSCVADGPGAHLTGSRVWTSDPDKPIAITIYDDSNHHPAGSCKDLIGDQLVPVDVLGHEYIAMRGALDHDEKVFIVGTQTDTKITIDNVVQKTIGAGEAMSYELTQEATHIEGSNPIYVHHVSGYGCEVGGAILPTIDGCTGSYDVYITRTTTQDFFLNMMIEASSAVNEFYIEYENGDVYHISDAWFTDKNMLSLPPDKRWLYLDTSNTKYEGTFKGRGLKYNASGDPIKLGIPDGEVVHIYNDGGEPFHLGFNNGGPKSGCNYGYFSDFKVVESEVYEAGTHHPVSEVCFGNTVQLKAAGGYEYTWLPNEYRSYLSDYKSQTPVVDAPPGYYDYEVRIQGGCDLDDTLSMPVMVLEEVKAKFQLDTTYGCSPLEEVTITNNSVNEYEPYSYWNYGRYSGDESGAIDDTTLEYTNTSDTVRRFNIEAIIQNAYGCADTLTRTLTENPFITDSIAPADTTGCNPLSVQFRNYTYGGNMEDNTYLWEFGDGNSVYDSIPEHTFQNPSGSDTTYTTIMTAESKFGCVDHDTSEITVHSYINASFSMDTTEGCSPLTVDGSVKTYPGISSYQWDFGDGYTPSGTSPFPHTYNNLSGTSDTLQIKLVVGNGNCQDSMSRQVIIHPEVHADFTPMDTVGCNPVNVGFTNKSTYSTQSGSTGLNYQWNFGDGNSSNEEDPTHVFSNPSYSDTTYDVNLTVTSPNGCMHDTSTTVEVYSYIQADFSATNVSGCSPLTVTVDDNSKGNIDYHWFWDDNPPPDMSNPDSTINDPQFTKTYVNKTGMVQEKYLTLIVENNQDCRDTLKRKITIYPEVTAEFTPFNTSAGCNPHEVTFKNNSHYSGTSLTSMLSYSWDFGDGGSSIAENPTHTFTNNQINDTTYDVNLLAVSPYGCMHDTTGTVEVYSYVNADFTVSNVEGCSPLKVNVTDNSTGNVDYFWFWDDASLDTTSQDSSISASTFDKTYVNQTGSVQEKWMTLIIANSHGCTDTVKRKITIYPEVTANFSPLNSSDCNPFNVQFTNHSEFTGDPGNSTNLSYNWYFGNNASSSDTDPEHAYVNPSANDSTFHPKLVVTSPHGCKDSITGNITVHENIEASFTVNEPSGCAVKTVTINNNSTGGIDPGPNGYKWDYGDGSSVEHWSGSSNTHDYENTTDNPVDYTLELTVQNDDGCTSSMSQEITVYPNITADFAIDAPQGWCHPVDVNFTDQSDLPSSPTPQYFWDFGNGATSNSENPTQTFYNFSNTADSTYDVTLEVTSYDCKDTLTRQVTINHNPIAKFDIDRTEGCTPLTINATNQSVGQDASEWRYDDGSPYSSSGNTTHTYNNTTNGVKPYDLELYVETSEGCDDSTGVRLNVYPEVTADFDIETPQGCAPVVTGFTNNSQNADNYNWDFDDGLTSSQENPMHKFTNTSRHDTTYHVELISSSAFECVDTITRPVKVNAQPKAEFTITQESDLQTWPNSKVFMENNSNHGPWNYTWDFDDGKMSSKRSPNFHDYEHWGKYDIELEINSQTSSCWDTISKGIEILAPNVYAEFSMEFADPKHCEPLLVDFTAEDAPFNESYDYRWDFGDGTSAKGRLASHQYDSAGTYYVKLTATGEGGEDIAYDTVKVYQRPDVNFDVDPKLIMLPDQEMNCYNFTKYAESYTWDFGDGSTSEKEAPVYQYKKVGHYNITLTALSDKGCRAMDSLPDRVEVRGKGHIEFPNAFTPSESGPSDGYYDPEATNNNIFHPVYEGVKKKEYTLEIYNKWGERLFISHDVDKGWDGYYDGKIQPQDVYIWKAEGRFYNGQSFERMGDVTLLREFPEGKEGD